jgi:hypothetical protein
VDKLKDVFVQRRELLAHRVANGISTEDDEVEIKQTMTHLQRAKTAMRKASRDVYNEETLRDIRNNANSKRSADDSGSSNNNSNDSYVGGGSGGSRSDNDSSGNCSDANGKPDQLNTDKHSYAEKGTTGKGNKQKRKQPLEPSANPIKTPRRRRNISINLVCL